ncbi:MAG TPA: hypothetical protein VHE34_19935 [Puia sp.]|uniref:hypothetical protein n=1 Tax=Puia sp. TaxID=2045100 RepID=UPI002CDE6CB4|nr:hypothetical protein [Puia sp.]HVU97509.1 hypothetical protein [Puia sp.]
MQDKLRHRAEIVCHSNDRKATGKIEQQTRADPKIGVAGQIDRPGPLEKFEEVENAKSYQKQAPQGIGDRMECIDLPLDEKNINNSD